MKFERDEALRPFATDRQWEILEAIWETGSQKEAAIKLGLGTTRVSDVVDIVRRKAAAGGYSPEHDMTRTVPEGYRVRGISTLYNKEGGMSAQWVKSQIDPAQQEQFLREAAAAFAAQLPRAEPVPALTHAFKDNLLAGLPIGDHHFGLHTWKVDTGTSYDLDIALNIFRGAVDHLVAATPACGTALLAPLGDLFHYDSTLPVTPTSGNILDADSRFGKMVRMTILGIRYAIRALLEKHAKVHVIIEVGNHDLASSVWLMECLAQVYENEPRVVVDTSPSHFHYFEFGKVLIGTHHGHGPKMERLPIVMAVDRAEAWGRTKHRYFWTGHIHKDTVQDNGGVRVESFRVLPPVDTWAHQKGYRSTRSMSSILFHREHGEAARFTVNPDMLLDA